MSSSIALPSEETATVSLADLRTARNRQNAQKSTGPRTKQGKQRSAQNARTHGLTANTPPHQLPVPDPTANLTFDILKRELTEEHRPTTPTQRTLLDELTLIIWKLQYIPRIEHRLLNTPHPEDRPKTPQPNPAHLTPHPRLDHEGDPTAAVYALHLSQDTPTPLTRLFNLQHRLQARLNSILNQLRRLRKDHQLHHEDDQDLCRAQRNAEVDQTLHQRALDAQNQRAIEQGRAPARIEPTSPPIRNPQSAIGNPPNAPAQIEPTSTPPTPVALNLISPTMRNSPPSGRAPIATNNQKPATFNADP
ncbi:MAG: hypothetical protein JWN40_4493 [Phycisphaerales bacterium]|nr:hypothetical protein [Phycisphaerales bacterium]